VAIARAIVSEPRLVIADEPVSVLDMTIQLQVLTAFQRLQEHYGFACLFITHDLAVVEQAAEDVLGNPQHADAKPLLAATPSLIVAAIMRTRSARFD